MPRCDDRHYNDVDAELCEPCHEECESCTAATNADCIRCKHFRVYRHVNIIEQVDDDVITTSPYETYDDDATTANDTDEEKVDDIIFSLYAIIH